ncbi:MAG: glycosyltransferase family 4 protein [Bacteroides sp.]
MIYIDNIIYYLQKSGGVSVVWTELISRLLYNNENVRFLQYRKRPENLFYNSLSIPHDRLSFLRSICLPIQRYLPLLLSSAKEASLFHSSYYRYSINPNVINITTVHDFTYEYFSSGLKAKLHRWQKFNAIRHSKYIICISENTKKDLLKFLPDVDPDKIRVIYNGVSNDYYQMNLLEKSSSESIPYVVFVGARSDYKNFSFTVRSLVGTKYHLKIVGNPLTKVEISFLNDTIGSSNYSYAGRVSNQELNVIYNNAFALMYPSSYEGFGIPVLEAQKAGCPVIAYNASSIPEIIGNTPLLLNNLDLQEVHNCFEIIEDECSRLKIINDGLENVKRFSWESMYFQVRQLYNEALQSMK